MLDRGLPANSTSSREKAMLWVIHLLDKADSGPLRVAHLEAHKDYLHRMDPVCFFTGPLQSDDASRNVGSLWIISANSRAEARAFVEGEAFFQAGVFQSYQIHRLRMGHFHPELVS